MRKILSAAIILGLNCSSYTNNTNTDCRIGSIVIKNQNTSVF